MTIRTALVGGISALLLLSLGVVSLIGTRLIRESVVREAQSRVDHDLALLRSLYESELRADAEALRAQVDDVGIEPGASDLDARLLELRGRLGWTVLNFSGPSGEPIAGAYGDRTGLTPIEEDPVLRAALEGHASRGTLLLSGERLRFEGGTALASSQRIEAPDEGGEGTEEALFFWHAIPNLDESGKVTGVIYGGRAINHHYDLVDRFARILFGERLHQGKPVGTVTIFLGDTRVATNVRDSAGNRALGTRVSDEVREHVLGKEEAWKDRAWVVDSWYLSGYEPLQDPTGHTVGMLYVGLLEAPYEALGERLVLSFVIPALLLLALAWASTIWVVARITRPLEQLRDRAARMAAGDLDRPLASDRSYEEIQRLSDAFNQMQASIHERDRDLRVKNRELAATNEEVVEANENYMNTLGFVTHELKAPLANMQSWIELLLDSDAGKISPDASGMLTRVRRNCEDLQGMVKDYLDLSRAERGGLVPTVKEIDFISECLDPATLGCQGLLASRRLQLEVRGPDALEMEADPELLRIALANYLSNAAKYGREGGEAKLEVGLRDGELVVELWNQGDGFAPEDQVRLFEKFSRLRNENTRSKKGSGVGLFLTAEIVREHGGRTWADSEPGQWARFGFALPIRGERS